MFPDLGLTPQEFKDFLETEQKVAVYFPGSEERECSRIMMELLHLNTNSFLLSSDPIACSSS